MCTTCRFSDDSYDRIWTREAGGNGLREVSSDALISVPGLADEPPPAVLRNAVTPISPNSSLPLFMGFPPFEVPVYLNWYFSEVTKLEPNQTRSFRLFMGNLSISEPILPIFGNFTELYVSNLTVSSNTTFSLVPSNDSTLPPLINAMEVFIIGDRLTNGTNRADGTILFGLMHSFAFIF